MRAEFVQVWSSVLFFTRCYLLWKLSHSTQTKQEWGKGSQRKTFYFLFFFKDLLIYFGEREHKQG